MPKIVYCTDSPCVMCAKYLVNMGGVTQVLYTREYRIRDGLDILERSGIAAVRFEVKA